MIYDFPKTQDLIRQGDIFRYIPKIDLDLNTLRIYSETEDALIQESWLTATTHFEEISTLVAIKPVTAIVITQDCDAVRNDDIALCEILKFAEVERSVKDKTSPNAFMSAITKQSRLNQKWFYLPPDETIGFSLKMGVDFHLVTMTSRSYLEDNISKLRIGRLNKIALEHFREKLSEYFRRYPYDEWYPLNKEEFIEYKKNKPEPIEPFPYQV
jgi:hypothetical protein